MHESRTGDLTRAQYYDRIRSQIEHEDELINLRVVWQLLAQSFFFSTYASLLTADKQAKSMFFHEEQDVLFWLVPVAALLAGLLTAISIFTSLANIAHLRHLFEAYAKKEAAEDQSAKLFPPIQEVERFRKLANIAPIGLPLLFIVAWLVILIRPLFPPS
jgi:type II secretory pathway component PulL